MCATSNIVSDLKTLVSPLQLTEHVLCRGRAAIKVEKKDGEEVDYNKLRVKALKSILADRGVKCTGCTEKPEFVKKCQETEHLEM